MERYWNKSKGGYKKQGLKTEVLVWVWVPYMLAVGDGERSKVTF